MVLKKINKTKIIVLLMIILAIIIAVIGCVFNLSEIENIIETAEIEAKYYLVQQDYKYGVIDTEGNIVIDIQYEDIDIPNPEKEIFVCTKIQENGLEETKILNSRKEEILKEFSNVSTIELNDDENEIEYEKHVLRYEENGKYGIINFDGKKVTEAIYDEIEALKYKEGDLLVKKDDKYGVINSQGKVVIKPKYDTIEGDGYYNSETKYSYTGYIVCSKENNGYKYGYIGSNGKKILKNEYSEIYRVLEADDKQNVYLIARKNGKVGFIKNNKKILDYEYQNIEYDPINKLIKVQRNTSYGVYNINGEEIIQAKYKEISFRGKYIYAQREENIEYFTLNGQVVNNLNYLSINETDNENFYTCINADGLYGILDKNENVLVENEYAYLEYLYNDYFIAIEEEKLGVIKSNNDIMIPFEYDTIDKLMYSNLVQAVKQDGATILFSKDLKIIDGMSNSSVNQIGNITKVYNEKESKYFDKEGNQVDLKEVFSGKSLYPKQQEMKWGFEDKDGNLIVEYKYDYTTELNKYGFASIKLDGKWGCIDESGKVIVDPKLETEEGQIPSFIGTYYTLEQGNEAIYYTE